MSDRLLRRLVPSLPPLTRNRALMWPLDVADRVMNSPWRELRGLPPNRMRLRVGVQNRVLCNGLAFKTMGVAFWMGVLARRHARLDSRILDLGSGCGRFALPLRDHNFYGQRFRGRYLGVDIDEEMLSWCRRNFDARFDWHDARKASATYRPAPGNGRRVVGTGLIAPPPNPHPVAQSDDGARGLEDSGATGGSPAHGGMPTTPGLVSNPLRLPLQDSSRDLALANSLFSHLLEADFVEYVREAARVIRPGGWFYLTVFIREHVAASGRLSGRWTFRHQRGAAWIESQKYPEAAVAYDLAWVRATLRRVGFGRIRMTPTPAQTLVWCMREP